MPSRCANTGTRASCLHARDQALAAARHDHVDVAVEARAASAPTAARSRVGTSWMASSGRPAARRPATGTHGSRALECEALGAAAQDRGIAGLEAERAGIGRHVRAALVDDADDAERHAHALDRQAVRPRPALRSLRRPDRRARRRPRGRPPSRRCACRRARAGRGRRRSRRAPCASAMSSALAARMLVLAGADRVRHRGQRFVFLRRGRERQGPRGRPRPPPDLGHDDVGHGFDCLERRRHGFDPSFEALSYHVRPVAARPVSACLPSVLAGANRRGSKHKGPFDEAQGSGRDHHRRRPQYRRGNRQAVRRRGRQGGGRRYRQAARRASVAGAIRAKGGEAELFVADVSKGGEVAALVKAVVDRFCRVDILVNNVAISDNKHMLRHHRGGMGQGDRRDAQEPVPDGQARRATDGPRRAPAAASSISARPRASWAGAARSPIRPPRAASPT